MGNNIKTGVWYRSESEGSDSVFYNPKVASNRIHLLTNHYPMEQFITQP